MTGHAGVVNSRSNDIMEDESICKFLIKPNVTISLFKSGSIIIDRADKICSSQSDGGDVDDCLVVASAVVESADDPSCDEDINVEDLCILLVEGIPS